MTSQSHYSHIEPNPQGSVGNVIAALCSFFFPGLGQLLQGRLFMATFFFLSTTILYALAFLVLPLPLALIMHLWAILNAAMFSPR